MTFFIITFRFIKARIVFLLGNVCLLYLYSFADEENKQTSTSLKEVKLSTSYVSALQESEPYQSGNTLNSRVIETNPAGNGDITSLLRILPNVQYDNTQLRGTTPGEIDPARISISGGLHYQNNFMVDGININNDLNPAQVGSTWTSTAPGRSQGMAIDTSLLDSIKVLDSNISAAYGGFTGGFVEATTRKANKKIGANMSYQITQGNAEPGKFSLTNYHIYGDETNLENFINSSSASESQNNSPVFIKHLVRLNMESKMNDKFGILASFSTTQSFIPLRRVDNDYLNTTRYPIPIGVVQDGGGFAKKTQVRKNYNYFIKANYDYSQDLEFELTYTYAPDYNNRFLLGGRPDQSYDWVSGGHNVGFKTILNNVLGKLTYTAGYSYLQNSTLLHNFEHTKYWRISDSKNWANWAGMSREGGYAPSESIQHSFSSKFIQDFKPFDLLWSVHNFQMGLELGYQIASFEYTHDYIRAQSTLKIQDADKDKCRIGDEWCDPSKTYVIKRNGTNYNLDIWDNGQFFYLANLYRGHTIFDNALFSSFIEDDIAIPLWGGVGTINLRPGVRVDIDTYMAKLTTAPRLSIAYDLPWNDMYQEFATILIGGINRYYGRNIFAYKLRADLNSKQTSIYRKDPGEIFFDILADGKMCSGTMITDSDTGVRRYDDNCIVTYKNQTRFNQLRVPYVDELSIGLTQRFYDWSFAAKYIYREGKDDIRYVRSDYVGLSADSNFTNTYYTYTNEGKSWTDVITLVIENYKPIEFWGTRHFVLFAFDQTNVKRNFNDYASAASLEQLEDNDILWEGKIVPYSQRPASNFLRPYTLRLNTTHNIAQGRLRWLLNNFFRYRSSYDAVARIHIARVQYTGTRTGREHVQYNPEHNDKDQFVAQKIRESFTWDMRVGFELDTYRGNTLYVNVDVYNLLDAKNPTIFSSNYNGTSASPVIGYEVGRQFWVQVGYKY